MSSFPLTAEQIVRLTAAVLHESQWGPREGESRERHASRVLLELARAADVAVAMSEDGRFALPPASGRAARP